MYCVVLHVENDWYKVVIFHTNDVIGLTLQDIDDPIGLHFFYNHRLNFRVYLFVLFIKRILSRFNKHWKKKNDRNDVCFRTIKLL